MRGRTQDREVEGHRGSPLAEYISSFQGKAAIVLDRGFYGDAGLGGRSVGVSDAAGGGCWEMVD